MTDRDKGVQIEDIEQIAQIGREGTRTAMIGAETTAKGETIEENTAETEIETTQIETETIEETKEIERVGKQGKP